MVPGDDFHLVSFVHNLQTQCAASTVDRHVAAEFARTLDHRAVNLDGYVAFGAETAEFDDFNAFPGGQIDDNVPSCAEVDPLDINDFGMVHADLDPIVLPRLSPVDFQNVVTGATIDDVEVIQGLRAARIVFGNDQFVRGGSFDLVAQTGKTDGVGWVEQRADAVPGFVETELAVDVAQDPARRAGLTQLHRVVRGDFDFVDQTPRHCAEICMGRMTFSLRMDVLHSVDDRQSEFAEAHSAVEQAGNDVHSRSQ